MSTASSIRLTDVPSDAGRRARNVLLRLALAATVASSVGILASATLLAGMETPLGVSLTGIVILAMSVLVPTVVLPMGVSAAARDHLARITSGPSASWRLAAAWVALFAAGLSTATTALAWIVPASNPSVWAVASIAVGVIGLGAVAASLLPWPRARHASVDDSAAILNSHPAS